MKSIQKIYTFLVISFFGSYVLTSCEPESDNLGEQFFNGTNLNTLNYDLLAYNIDNKDTLRSDATELQLATLGAFTDGVFGMQKSSFVSQVRLNSYNPDFGANPIVDSVVLVIKPLYASDSATTSTYEDFIHPDGNVPAKKVVVSYPVSKYGKTKIGGNTIFNIKVHEVDEFLGAASEMKMSNQFIPYSTEIGSMVFNGKISSTTITKDSDNSNIWTNDASLRIPLSNSFFQSKILAKQGSSELKDAANFIRYFKGIRLSVVENDGYIFKFNPLNTEIILYYKYDKTENNVTTRTQANIKFNLGSPNARFGQYQYSRTDTPFAAAMSSIDSISGDPKIFLQGMGGASMGVKIKESTILDLKTRLLQDKIGIIGAKIRVYTDVALWNNSYTKPTDFTVLQNKVKSFLPEFASLSSATNFRFISPYNLDKNPAYYDISITETLKKIIEKNAENKGFIIEVGSFRISEATSLLGYQYDTRAYTPNRIVLVGSDNTNANRIQLIVNYGKN